MRFKGGYNLQLQGRPDRRIDRPSPAGRLVIPLAGPRLRFKGLRVAQGQIVRPGEVLAVDPASFDVPLLAPMGGKVNLEAQSGHIVLESLNGSAEPAAPEPATQGLGPRDATRRRLLSLGAWTYLQDAHSGGVPDPTVEPEAVIVSTLHLEPFVARGDVQLYERIDAFTAGLELLQSLLEYQPIHLVLPDIQTQFANRVREALRGLAFIKLVEVPLQYPFDHFSLIARGLGYKYSAGQAIWGIHTEGVLAVEAAMKHGTPSLTRLVSFGGPVVKSPSHMELPIGYPLANLLDGRIDSDDEVRVIDGGVMTGMIAGEDIMGVSAECTGITAIADRGGKELFGWLRPGLTRRSYSRCFLSVFRGPFAEAHTTATRGELRACVACGQCEQVCPVGIMPWLIHKHLYQDQLEQTETDGAMLCVGCGLCSYVCPSKIELREQILDAQRRIADELAVVEEASE